jgi:hypothetical protein
MDDMDGINDTNLKAHLLAIIYTDPANFHALVKLVDRDIKVKEIVDEGGSVASPAAAKRYARVVAVYRGDT